MARWFVQHPGAAPVGPIDAAELQAAWIRQQIPPGTMACAEGFSQWVPFHTIAELIDPRAMRSQVVTLQRPAPIAPQKPRPHRAIWIGVTVAALFSVLAVGGAITASVTKARREELRKAQSDKCRQSSDCTTSGKCSSDERGDCVAASAADCEHTDACRKYGFCSPSDSVAKVIAFTQGVDVPLERGTCVIATDADCARTEGCRDDGLCTARAVRDEPTSAPSPWATFGPHMTCTIGSDADCRKTSDCKRAGACGYDKSNTRPGRGCIAISDNDCRQSNECETDGRCTVGKAGTIDSQSCWAANDADCRQSTSCRTEHKCWLHAGYAKYCCTQSEVHRVDQ